MSQATTPGPASAAGAASKTVTRQDVLVAVQRMFSSPKYKPPMLPVVAMKVLELSRSSDVSFDAFVTLLESDSLLAGQIIKLAASPLYSSVVPIQSIKQALLRLGQRTLTDLCLQAAMTGKVFRAPGLDHVMERIRAHCVAVGHISRLICNHKQLAGDDAFLIGLMHDSGIAIGVLALNSNGQRTDWGTAYGALLEAHQAVVEQLVLYWQLPEDFLIPLIRHHQPDMLLDTAGAAVILADVLADELGYGVPPGPLGTMEGPPVKELAQDLLELSDEEVRTITKKSDELLRLVLGGGPR